MTSTAPIGYAVTLPPGWLRIPVEGSEPVIAVLLDETFGDLPRDRYGPYRAELERILREQVAGARANSGIDLYLPTGGMRGLPVAASFVVSHLPPSGQAPPDVLAALAVHDGSAEPVEIAGTPGMRLQRRAASEPARQHGLNVDTERVTYVLPVPGRGGWLLLSFSTAVTPGVALPDGVRKDVGTLTGVLVELFDALVTTLRWRYG